MSAQFDKLDRSCPPGKTSDDADKVSSNRRATIRGAIYVLIPVLTLIVFVCLQYWQENASRKRLDVPLSAEDQALVKDLLTRRLSNLPATAPASAVAPDAISALLMEAAQADPKSDAIRNSIPAAVLPPYRSAIDQYANRLRNIISEAIPAESRSVIRVDTGVIRVDLKRTTSLSYPVACEAVIWVRLTAIEKDVTMMEEYQTIEAGRSGGKWLAIHVTEKVTRDLSSNSTAGVERELPPSDVQSVFDAIQQ